jgi:hypothetical protein
MAQTTISTRVPRVTDIFTVRTTTVGSSQITAAANAVVSGGVAFTLSDVDGYTSYTSVFDQYRIDAVTVTLRAGNNAIGLVTNTST